MRNPGLPAKPSFLRVSTGAGVPHLLVLKYLAISRQMQVERGLGREQPNSRRRQGTRV
jgi:hypothetical protein